MNILFMTLSQFTTLNESDIYTDLLREFVKNGHRVYAISPTERRQKLKTRIIKEKNAIILRLQIGNTQKTNAIEKGISTVLLERQYKLAIKRYFGRVHFDLILYSTPPITLLGAVEYVKKRNNAKTYLLLKDIFPQNAVDIGMISDVGIRGVIYNYFRRREKEFYAISDRIGCMSEANVEYVLLHNSEVKERNVTSIANKGNPIIEVCPNSIEPEDLSVLKKERRKIRDEFSIPQDKTVFVYGGNLGKAQGIPFLLKCIHSQRNNNKCYFLIVGNGTEYKIIRDYIFKQAPKNMKLFPALPREEYNRLMAACDVGMIFLDHRFTIPNIPSRILSYMQAKLPVLACTDPCTDIGRIIINGKFGWWCESNNVNQFKKTIDECLSVDLTNIGQNAYEYLINHYSSKKQYYTIIKHFEEID